MKKSSMSFIKRITCCRMPAPAFVKLTPERPAPWFRAALLVCFAAFAPNPANGNGRAVSVGVFSLFRPNGIELETRRETMLSILNGAAATRRVLIEGQRLEVTRLGEWMEVRLVERDGRLLEASRAERVQAQESKYRLRVPGRIERQFFGKVEIVVARQSLLPKVLVAEETAVAQILRSEMADVQESETLKAQATLIRSYLRTSGRRHPNEGYDFCDTTHCQFFAAFQEDGDRSQRAAIDSRSLVLTFLGKPFQPLYTAACGGRTLEGYSVGDGSKQGSGYAYRAVVCNFCSKHPSFVWETNLDRDELVRALKEEADQDPATILARLAQPGDHSELVELRERMRLRVGRRLGWNIIRSNRYTIAVNNHSAAITGHGSGHNRGLCQAGAIELGRQGKTMSEILAFYFPGCRVSRQQ